MTKVFAVSQGSYSDYSVVAVFDNPDLAHAHQAEIDPGNNVEAFDVLSDAPTRFSVYSKSNDTHEGDGVPHEWSYLAWSYNRGIYKRAEVTKYRSRGFTAVRVVGWDKEAVTKAYADTVAKVEAEAQGLA